MADLSVTAANVVAVAGLSAVRQGVAGGTLTRGEPIYFDASGLGWAAKADTAAHAAVGGISLSDVAAGQQFIYALPGSQISYGAIFTLGVALICSPNNAGGVAPVTDVGSGTYTTLLGVPTTTSILLFNPTVGGAVHA